jgi:lysophospholipase L1-like esterase
MNINVVCSSIIMKLLIKLIAVFFSIQCVTFSQAQNRNIMKILALGDSYTIGEKVQEELNFPNQTKTLLQKAGKEVSELQVIAATGWTTEELIGPMETQVKQSDFDWVTLLIGVNNQYRGRSVDEYEIHFKYLCSRALSYANNKSNRVVVLSIPDWGMTPFNTERDKVLTSKAIDEYNEVNKRIATQFGFHYIDITPSTRAHAQDTHYLAEDKLHPSQHEYSIWAQQVFDVINSG